MDRRQMLVHTSCRFDSCIQIRIIYMYFVVSILSYVQTCIDVYIHLTEIL